MQQSNYQNTGSFQNYPQEQYIRPQGSGMSQQGEFNQPYTPRTHYPPYVPDSERLVGLFFFNLLMTTSPQID